MKKLLMELPDLLDHTDLLNDPIFKEALEFLYWECGKKYEDVEIVEREGYTYVYEKTNR